MKNVRTWIVNIVTRIIGVEERSRTEIIFGIHKKRLEEYKTGKTSCNRYFSIALMRVYKYHFPEADISVHTTLYRVHCIEESSGRILTVLEDNEMKSNHIRRGKKTYLVNPNIPSVPSSHEEQQLRLAAGLTPEEATELVPLNENIQLACLYNDIEMIKRSMRHALYNEQQKNLFLIDICIQPGMGWGYGNPVFLSLKNALAYEDFIRKNFGVSKNSHSISAAAFFSLSLIYPCALASQKMRINCWIIIQKTISLTKQKRRHISQKYSMYN